MENGKKVILVVDDEKEVRDMIYRAMINHGYIIRCYENVSSAMFHLENVDIVIADLELPVQDGFDFHRLLKKKAPDILFVGISGVRGKSKDDFFKLCDKAIEKPFRLAELRNVITSLFSAVVLVVFD